MVVGWAYVVLNSDGSFFTMRSGARRLKEPPLKGEAWLEEIPKQIARDHHGWWASIEFKTDHVMHGETKVDAHNPWHKTCHYAARYEVQKRINNILSGKDTHMKSNLKDIRNRAVEMAQHQKQLQHFTHPKFGVVTLMLSDAEMRVIDEEAKIARLSRSRVLFGPVK